MRNSLRLIAILLVIFALFGIGSFLLSKKKLGVAGDKRQAVFLTNGQIYFGDLTRANGQFIELKNVFYPQSSDFLRADNGGKKKVTLQRLGEELHGPEPVVYINRDHILYYENMRNDSKINEAISKYIEDKSKTNNQEASPSPSVAPTQ